MNDPNVQDHIVADGGWRERTTWGKQKSRLFWKLSFQCLFFTAIAAYQILGRESRSQFSLLDMVAVCTILAQVVLFAISLYFLITERRRKMTAREQSPDYDLRKLY